MGRARVRQRDKRIFYPGSTVPRSYIGMDDFRATSPLGMSLSHSLHVTTHPPYMNGATQVEGR